MAELWLIWISLFLLSLGGLAGVAAIVGAILWWSARMTRRKSRQVKGATQRYMERNA
jgi:nitrate reductase gamma subunit